MFPWLFYILDKNLSNILCNRKVNITIWQVLFFIFFHKLLFNSHEIINKHSSNDIFVESLTS